MQKLKSTLKIVFAVFLAGAGINHFLKPDFYLRMMPPYLPLHLVLVYLSGIAEVALGICLLIPRTSVVAAWGIIALLVAVFPANIQMAIRAETFLEFSVAALWIRLPLQGVLIAWAYWYTRPSFNAEKHGPPP